MDIKSNSISAAQVREIRLSAGLTQQGFASELQVGKVTVARWESGARTCRGEYARRVRQFSVNNKKETARTSTVFGVNQKDLIALNSDEAVKVFRDLLWCEVRRLGVPTSAVKIGTREIPDGGIDAIFESGKTLELADSFLCPSSHFQIKAGTSWKPWRLSFASKELLNKNGELGVAVKECLSSGGSYTLACFGNDLTPAQRANAEKNIKEIFEPFGFPAAKVSVWGVQELLGHVQRFPFLSLRLNGRNNFQFQSWSSWGMSAEMSTDLELGEAQELFREEIRRLVRDNDVGHVRVIGEPGLGKTRLVHEALRADDLAPYVVYIQHAEDFQKSRLFHDLLSPDADYFLVLVLDECRPKDCAEIWDRLSKHSDRCKVITLDHDSFDPSDERFVELNCPRLDGEMIEKIINSYTTGAGGGRRWADLCSGVPRVAHAVGRNLKNNPEELLNSPSIKLVWDRFISGYRLIESDESTQKLTILRYIALFHRFGFEDPVSEEGKFIADWICRDHGISYVQFQKMVVELKRQRILQGKTTLFIAPKLLHVHLWTEFWELYGRNIDIGDLFKQIPESLMSWFVRMFPYAGSSPIASTQVARVLGPDGPFRESRFALSTVGCRFLHELSNAAPDKAVACLERIFKNATTDELKDLSRGRQDLVWALERIAVWPKHFCQAARLLRKLAETENSSNRNNSTGTFASLFCPAPGNAAPTGAPPETRLPILKESLGAKSVEIKRLGIKACVAALNTYPGIRIIGREYQGFKTADLWTPKKWGEVYDAMRNAWTVFYDSTRSWELGLRREANEGLVEAGFRLLSNSSLCYTVLETLPKLIDDEATDLQQVVKEIARVDFFSKEDEYPEGVLEQLSAIDKQIYGETFHERLRRVVHLSGWDDQYGPSGERQIEFNERVDALASEASQSDKKFEDVLQGLVVGTNNTVFQFGRELALKDNGMKLQAIIEAYRIAAPEFSPLFISGYLATIFYDAPDIWKQTSKELICDEAFRSIIGHVLRNSGTTDEIVVDLLERFDSGHLDINCLLAFGYSNQLTGLGEVTFLQFVDRLVGADQVSYAIGLFSVVYCNKRKPKAMPMEKTLELLQAFGCQKNQRDDHDYQWQEVANEFKKQFPDQSMKLYATVLDRIERRKNYHSDYSFSVVQPIVQSDPTKCWQALSDRIDAATGIERYNLLSWLGPEMSMDSYSQVGVGPIGYFPIDLVFEWIDRDPDARAYELIQAVPKSLANDEIGIWARELLVRYGHQDDVRRGLHSHFWAGGWCGNLSDRFRTLRETARGWLEEETSLRIREWIEEFIDCLSHDITRAEIEEERQY